MGKGKKQGMPKVLADAFQVLADAPNGITKLRELILDLAVSGKLVSQESKDEPALELLQRIEAVRHELVEDKLARKSKPMPPVDEPTEFPDSWAVTRLGNLGLVNPRNTLNDGKDAGFLPMKSILAGFTGGHTYEQRQWSEVKKGFTHLASGDVVMAKITPCFQNRKSTVVGELPSGFGAGTTELYVLRPLGNTVAPRFVLCYLKSQIFIAGGLSQMTGTAGQQRVPKSYFQEAIIGLPPLAEQKRIVEKVDALMALCDEMEAKKEARSTVHLNLTKASLSSLTEAEDAKGFDQAWKHVSENFDTLITTPESVSSLRQSILDLAVRGKLVPQDPKDEPASELLKRIEEERNRLIAEKVIKKQKKLPAIDSNLAPFKLPMGWSWARFPELGEFGRGKSKHRPRNDPKLYANGSIPLIQTGQVARAKGQPVITAHSFYNEVGLAQSRLWPKGTMCITIAANIADSAILGMDACFPDSVVGFIPSSEIPNARYYEYFVRTARSALEKYAPSTAQKNINLSILQAVLIPLPPLAEQQRIVERVDSLMILCDQLESNLSDSGDLAEKLASSVVSVAS